MSVVKEIQQAKILELEVLDKYFSGCSKLCFCVKKNQGSLRMPKQVHYWANWGSELLLGKFY